MSKRLCSWPVIAAAVATIAGVAFAPPYWLLEIALFDLVMLMLAAE